MSTIIEQRVIKVISDILDIKEGDIQLDVSLRNDLHLDSLQQMTLFIALEDEFQRSIPPEEAESLATIKDVIDFVERKTREPSLA